MHLELGQSTVDLFHVFCGQYKFGGFDVLLKVLALVRPRDRGAACLLRSEPCEGQLRCCCVFPSRKLVDASVQVLLVSYAPGVAADRNYSAAVARMAPGP